MNFSNTFSCPFIFTSVSGIISNLSISLSTFLSPCNPIPTNPYKFTFITLVDTSGRKILGCPTSGVLIFIFGISTPTSSWGTLVLGGNNPVCKNIGLVGIGLSNSLTNFLNGVSLCNMNFPSLVICCKTSLSNLGVLYSVPLTPIISVPIPTSTSSNLKTSGAPFLDIFAAFLAISALNSIVASPAFVPPIANSFAGVIFNFSISNCFRTCFPS